MVDPRLDRDDAVDLEDVARSPGAAPAARAPPCRGRGRGRGAKSSPKPASAITSRATASTSRPDLAGPGRLEPRELRLQADVVGARELVRQLARRERPRAVRVVAVDLRGGVDHDRLARLDRDVARARVRQRAVRPAGDDRRERHVLGAEVAHRPLDPPGELLLGAAGEALLGQAGERLVRDRRRPADRVQLARLLDRAHRLQQLRRRHRLDAAGVDRRPRRVRQMLRLERDALRQQLRQLAYRGREGSRPPRARSPSPSRGSGSR